MSAETMFNESMDARVEVFEDHLILVLPRKMDNLAMSWQDAMSLGDVLEQAAVDIPLKPLLVDPQAVLAETEQVKVNTHKDRNVVLLFEWTDRLRFCAQAAVVVGRAIRMYAQDLHLLLEKGVRMLYSDGRPMPSWSYERKTFGSK